ncbi:unnamed protein product [Cochlearia groenlandica]
MIVIGVAVDLSEESSFAVRWAVDHYIRHGDAVVILQVSPTSVLFGADWDPLPLQFPPPSVDFSASFQIEKLSLSAVIMGSRGFGAEKKKGSDGKLGSVSDYCVCPVAEAHEAKIDAASAHH